MIFQEYVSLIPTRWGHMYCLTCDTYIRVSLSLYAESTQQELEICMPFIKPGDWVIDAGANIGTFALPFARRVGPSGQVFAFEPQVLVHMCLTTNLFINSVGEWSQPIQAALGDAPGTGKMPRLDPRKPNNIGGARLNDPDNKAQLTLLGSDDVNITTIDALNLERCDFIKTDVEGMDAKILVGGTETIKKFEPTILAEMLPHDGTGANNDAEQEFMRATIKSLGYKAKWIMSPLFNPANCRLEPVNAFKSDVWSFDLLAIPEDRAWPENLPPTTKDFA